jgi:hypothetical protein
MLSKQALSISQVMNHFKQKVEFVNLTTQKEAQNLEMCMTSGDASNIHLHKYI